MTSNGRLALQRWHRRLGIIGAACVILLAASGLALNHSDTLGLDETYVRAPFLLERYHLAPASEPVSYAVGEHSVTRVGERVFWGDTPLAEDARGLAGAVRHQDLIVVALHDRLLLLTPGGQVVERLGDAAAVPNGIRRIGVTPQGALAVDSPRGLEHLDLADLSWEPAPAVGVRWARPGPLPGADRARLLARANARLLSLERVLLDLHSGRVLGPWGPWLVDAAAVLFLVLAVTGIGLWSRGRR